MIRNNMVQVMKMIFLKKYMKWKLHSSKAIPLFMHSRTLKCSLKLHICCVSMLRMLGDFILYKDKWFLHLEPDEVDSTKHAALIALLAEFGEGSSVTPAVMEEYGKVIIPDKRLILYCTHFKRQD